MKFFVDPQKLEKSFYLTGPSTSSVFSTPDPEPSTPKLKLRKKKAKEFAAIIKGSLSKGDATDKTRKTPFQANIQNTNLVLKPGKSRPDVYRWQNPDEKSKKNATSQNAIPEKRATSQKQADTPSLLNKELATAKLMIVSTHSPSGFRFKGKNFNLKVIGHTFPYKSIFENLGGVYSGAGSSWYFPITSREELASKILSGITKQIETTGVVNQTR